MFVPFVYRSVSLICWRDVSGTAHEIAPHWQMCSRNLVIRLSAVLQRLYSVQSRQQIAVED